MRASAFRESILAATVRRTFLSGGLLSCIYLCPAQVPLHGDDGYPGDDRYPGDRKYSFAEVLRQIESKGYTVGYPSRLMEQIPRVAVHLPLDSSLDKALKACLAG